MNINDYAYVRLTAHGGAIAAQEGYYREAAKPEWSQWQLWVLMSVFGPHLFNGCTQCFVNNEILFTDPREEGRS